MIGEVISQMESDVRGCVLLMFSESLGERGDSSVPGFGWLIAGVWGLGQLRSGIEIEQELAHLLEGLAGLKVGFEQPGRELELDGQGLTGDGVDQEEPEGVGIEQGGELGRSPRDEARFAGGDALLGRNGEPIGEVCPEMLDDVFLPLVVRVSQETGEVSDASLPRCRLVFRPVD